MKIYITEDDMCTTQKLNLARVHKWFEANNCTITEDKDEAEKIITMTCNGWSLLENRSYERIKDLKEKYNDKMIVMGCVVDSHPQKVESIFSGPVVKTKSEQALSFGGIEDLFPNFKINLSSIPAQSIFRKKSDYRDFNEKMRFINIAEGCAFACTFCTHKPGLGKRRSRPIAEIIDQIKLAVEKEGVTKIILMGMETAMYGIELKTNFPELLKETLNCSDNFEIHIAQFNPYGMDKYYEELLPLISNKRITDFQAPFQSISKRILGMMNRKYFNHEKVGEFLKIIKSQNTRVVLRTDAIVGWPTEKDIERYESLKWAAKYFDEVAVYSIELHPDLPAWKFKDDAFSDEELKIIQKDSRDFLKTKGIFSHSGQQDDETMESAEEGRIELRERKKSESNVISSI